MVLSAEWFVIIIKFSLFEAVASTLTAFSMFPWKLLTSPVGKVMLMRCPSELYLLMNTLSVSLTVCVRERKTVVKFKLVSVNACVCKRV